MSHIIQYVLLLPVVGLLSNTLLANPGKYPIQNFTPAEYQAGIQNIDFVQNRDMTLFVANNLGVLSYNGSAWKRHDYKTGKKKRSLAFDERTNRLYVGSQGEFGYFTGDWAYVSLVDRIPEKATNFDEVWDVFLIHSKVYFCTFQAIFVFDGKQIEVVAYQDGLERSFQAEGTLFSQSTDGLLLELSEGELVSSYPQDQRSQILAGVIPYEQGYLLFYNSGEIEWTNSFGAKTVFPDLIQKLRGTYVNHVMQLSDNRLVIATQRSGVLLYDPKANTWETISVSEGLASNACLRTFQDYSGNVWVGMQNGIALIHINSPMRLLNQDLNIQGSGYEAIRTGEGMYYTTSNGIYFRAEGASQSRFLEGTEGPAYSIQEVAGRYYAGHHRGLFVLENGSARQVTTTNGLWKVVQLRSRPGYAIAGTYNGLHVFRINDQQQLESVGPIEGFDASTRFFEEDQSGRIWAVQYYRGLYRLELSEDLTRAEVTNVSTGSDLPIKEQIILTRVEDDLFLATKYGLYQINPSDGSIFWAKPFADILGKEPIYFFEQDQKNNVHVLSETTAGFFKQISPGNYAFVPSSLYQLRYHLNNDLLHGSMQLDEGILFSANEGFIQFFPELEDPLKVEKPVIISQVYSTTRGDTLYHQKPFAERPERIQPLRISPQDKVLTFSIESFQFNDMDNEQFRYFLKGFDEEYSSWTSATTKEYTNLPDGDYEFVAQSRNYLGEIVSSQTLKLQVVPPFYRSTGAKIIYGLTGILLFLLIVGLQRFRYRQKERKLELDKQMALARKQQKLNDIQRQREKERLDMEEERMHQELQHVNKLLATSTMNLVVKNEFIESIKGELNEVKTKEEKRETKRALDKIIREIDSALRLEEDWEQFEYHFEAVHADFLTRFRADYPDLSPNDQKLCAFLRLNLSTKEIAQLLSISTRGVEVARYRLRKKLDLERGQNLSKFILEY